MPTGIPINFTIIRHLPFNRPIEVVSGFDCQAPLQLGVLGFKVLQMRRDGMQCCALGNVDQLRAIILHVLVSHNFVAASEQ